MPCPFEKQSQYSKYHEICTSGKVSNLIKFEKSCDYEEYELITHGDNGGDG
jgi:hypothetical protein